MNLFSNGVCLNPISGTNCETNIDECASNPCQNNATCLDGINNFTCDCQLGFTGPLCEENINECEVIKATYEKLWHHEVSALVIAATMLQKLKEKSFRIDGIVRVKCFWKACISFKPIFLPSLAGIYLPDSFCKGLQSCCFSCNCFSYGHRKAKLFGKAILYN